jgi:apolipoprotein D and lipocalin family protein
MINFKSFILFILFLTGCSMQQTKVPLVTSVDMDQFMGDWYVIAHIPTFIEKNAFNAVESYALNADGTIATTFTFNEGSFDGPQKIYRPKGFVVPETGNAEWGMQFIWPIKAQYKISYLDKNYTHTIVARDALDYVWLMSRNKKLPHEDIVRFTEMIKGMGYNTDNLRLVPQQ